jgi:hypothetical protein
MGESGLISIWWLPLSLLILYILLVIEVHVLEKKGSKVKSDAYVALYVMRPALFFAFGMVYLVPLLAPIIPVHVSGLLVIIVTVLWLFSFARGDGGSNSDRREKYCKEGRKLIDYYDRNGGYIGYSMREGNRVEYYNREGKYIGYSTREGARVIYYDKNGKYAGESENE